MIKIRHLLEGVAGETTRRFLQRIFDPIADRYSSCVLQNPGIVISGAGLTTAKTGATALVYVSGGTPVSVAGGTTLPALTAAMTFTTGQFLIVGFFGDAAGNLTIGAGAPGATLAKATFPSTKEGLAVLGYLIITYAGTFVGGTTPLDTATTTYVSPDGAFDTSVLIK